MPLTVSSNDEARHQPHVVIIGGGFGGLAAARALARAPVRVTLVDRHNYHVFQPLLYQVATASLSPGDIASPIRWILRRQANVTVLLADARLIDPDRSRVLLDEGELHYDYLIIAAGAAHAYFGHADWAAHAPGLKTLDDALEMRRRVLWAFERAERSAPATERRLLTFVIVGGGPTGVELAGALAEIARHALGKDFRRIRPESARIVLIEAGPDLLGAFPQTLRLKAGRSLTRLGVEVITGSEVVAVDGDGVVYRSALGGSSAPRHRVEAATVLWAAGVAASPLVTSLGTRLDRAGRVLADPTLTVPGHPEIFVVGDVCALEQDGRPLPGVAQVARQGGRHAASNLVRAIRGLPLESFRYRDYGSMAAIGRGQAIAQVHGLRAWGYAAWMMWLFTHIFWLIGFRNRLIVLIEWAWSYATRQRRVRLITGQG